MLFDENIFQFLASLVNLASIHLVFVRQLFTKRKRDIPAIQKKCSCNPKVWASIRGVTLIS